MFDGTVRCYSRPVTATVAPHLWTFTYTIALCQSMLVYMQRSQTRASTHAGNRAALEASGT